MQKLSKLIAVIIVAAILYICWHDIVGNLLGLTILDLILGLIILIAVAFGLVQLINYGRIEKVDWPQEKRKMIFGLVGTIIGCLRILSFHQSKNVGKRSHTYDTCGLELSGGLFPERMSVDHETDPPETFCFK
jgi:hypothetical protein